MKHMGKRGGKRGSLITPATYLPKRPVRGKR